MTPETTPEPDDGRVRRFIVVEGTFRLEGHARVTPQQIEDIEIMLRNPRETIKELGRVEAMKILNATDAEPIVQATYAGVSAIVDSRR